MSKTIIKPGQGWVDMFMEYMDNTEPPDLFKEWVAMTVLSATMQRKLYFKKGKYTFFPNLYVILVGPPATRKGTAMAPGRKMLTDIGIIPAANMTTLQALIRRLKESTTTTMTSDGRVVLHSSMLIYSTEWSVFTGFNNQELFTTLNNWFDCEHPWIYETKGQGVDRVPAVYVTMLGATTPQLLNIALPPESIGGGFTSRTIFVIEQEQGKIIPPMDESNKEIALYDTLVERLQDIHQMAGPFQSTAEFDEAWADWYLTSRNLDIMPHQSLESYYGRRFRHLTAMAMGQCVAEGTDQVLEVRHLERASNLMDRTELKMPQVFRGFGSATSGDVMRNISTMLEKYKYLSQRDILKNVYGYLENGMDTFNQIMEVLARAGFLQIRIKDGTTYYKYLLDDD